MPLSRAFSLYRSSERDRPFLRSHSMTMAELRVLVGDVSE